MKTHHVEEFEKFSVALKPYYTGTPSTYNLSPLTGKLENLLVVVSIVELFFCVDKLRSGFFFISNKKPPRLLKPMTNISTIFVEPFCFYFNFGQNILRKHSKYTVWLIFCKCLFSVMMGFLHNIDMTVTLC